MSSNKGRLTQRSRDVLHYAQATTETMQHPTIEPHHILVGFIEEGGSVAFLILDGLGADIATVKQIIAQQPAQPENVGEITLADDTKQLLEFAVDEARQLGHGYLSTEHLLMAMIRQETFAVEILAQLGITPQMIRDDFILGLRTRNRNEPFYSGFNRETHLVIDSAQHLVIKAGSNIIEPAHLLGAMTRLEYTDAYYALADLDIVSGKIQPFLTTWVKKMDAAPYWSSAFNPLYDTLEAVLREKARITTADLLIALMSIQSDDIDDVLAHFERARPEVIERATYYLDRSMELKPSPAQRLWNWFRDTFTALVYLLREFFR